MMNLIRALIVICLLTSCVSTGIIDLPETDFQSNGTVSIIDERNSYDKKPSSSNWTIFLGDQNYQPNILDYLQNIFEKNKPYKISPNTSIRLNEFRTTIYNYAGSRGAMAGTLYSTTGILEISNNPNNVIKCQMSGKINQKHFNSEQYVSYHMPLFALTVFTDDETASAIDQCIDNLIAKIYGQ